VVKKKRRPPIRRPIHPSQQRPTHLRVVPDDEASPAEAELMRAIARMLDAGPLPMLEVVSMVLDGIDLRDDDALRPFLEVRRRETSAVLAVAAELVDDPALRARIRDELDTRAFALPRWLRYLAAPTIERCVEMAHVLRDGDNLLVGARLPTGEPITAVVYVDHNVGTLVKDAYIVDEPVDDLVAFMRSKDDDPDTTYDDLDPADARARIEAAIDMAAHVVPRFTTETWPAARPLVEWLVRELPTGGRGYEHPDWSDAQRTELTDRFFSSPYAANLDADARDLFDLVLLFGCDYGPGDPMRWSNVVAEVFLVDFVPRKYAGPAQDLDELPDLVRAFIRFCHHERGLRPALTAEALASVDEFEDEFRARLDDGAGILDLDDLGITAIMRETLVRAVGSEQALESLDDAPLPDEPFDWAAVPADIHDAVEAILVRCDDCCAAMFDLEMRTACRRVLARVAAGDPAVFRRKARPETGAATICWMTAKANELLTYTGLTAKELGEWFGLGSNPGARAQTFRKAGGWEQAQYGEMDLGSPAYLTGPRRRRLIELRERYRS
jgi:hypothetical protein